MYNGNKVDLIGYDIILACFALDLKNINTFFFEWYMYLIANCQKQNTKTKQQQQQQKKKPQQEHQNLGRPGGFWVIDPNDILTALIHKN